MITDALKTMWLDTCQTFQECVYYIRKEGVLSQRGQWEKPIMAFSLPNILYQVTSNRTHKIILTK